MACGSLFDRKQTNPVQDYIHWMNRPVIGFLWPFLLFAWLLTGFLTRVFWPDYVSHQERMERKVDDAVRDIDRTNSRAGTIDYSIPSPSAFRKRGMEAANIVVYQDLD
jgi:hypothetical protein